ncbi:MAG TPA: hypothetical protein VFV58_06730 [Blastocatellia bacterium]|nr:hypothetical protein [Blastocatellia bacterium]
MPIPDTKLLQGALDMLILKALSPGPLQGYGFGQRIMEMSEDALHVEEGSLYLALYRIERRGGLPPNGSQANVSGEILSQLNSPVCASSSALRIRSKSSCV